MASLKLTFAAVILAVAVISSVVADEDNTASLDGGYQKFPSRFRRESSVPGMSSISSFNPSQQLGQYPSIPGKDQIPDYQSMTKPENWKPETFTKPISQYTNGGKPTPNGNSPEAPDTENYDIETKCP